MFYSTPYQYRDGIEIIYAPIETGETRSLTTLEQSVVEVLHYYHFASRLQLENGLRKILHSVPDLRATLQELRRLGVVRGFSLYKGDNVRFYELSVPLPSGETIHPYGKSYDALTVLTALAYNQVCQSLPNIEHHPTIEGIHGRGVCDGIHRFTKDGFAYILYIKVVRILEMSIRDWYKSLSEYTAKGASVLFVCDTMQMARNIEDYLEGDLPRFYTYDVLLMNSGIRGNVIRILPEGEVIGDCL